MSIQREKKNTQNGKKSVMRRRAWDGAIRCVLVKTKKAYDLKTCCHAVGSSDVCQFRHQALSDIRLWRKAGRVRNKKKKQRCDVVGIDRCKGLASTETLGVGGWNGCTIKDISLCMLPLYF